MPECIGLEEILKLNGCDKDDLDFIKECEEEESKEVTDDEWEFIRDDCSVSWEKRTALVPFITDWTEDLFIRRLGMDFIYTR